MIYKLIAKRRTIRKFRPGEIDKPLLKEIADAARLAPSAMNLQPLELVIINQRKAVLEVFSHTVWAKYIYPEGMPRKGEEPAAFIAFVVNTDIADKEYYQIDCGLAAENLILAALGKGIGSCIIASCNKEKIGKIINIPANRKLEFVIALGYPAEKPVAEDAKSDSIKYYKDSKGVLHVPKRPFAKVVRFNSYQP